MKNLLHPPDPPADTCCEDTMAKALYGHLTPVDPRLVAELSRLRARVAALETENAALRSELGALPVDLLVPAEEPALT